MLNLYTSIRRAALRLRDDRSGAIAVQFAFAAVPLLGLMGIGVDYGGALRAKGVIQDGLDAAVLAGARDQTAAWETTALNVFNYNAQKLGTVPAPDFNRAADGSVTGSLTVPFSTSIIGVLGFSSIEVAANSTALVEYVGDRSCILALGGDDTDQDAMTFNGAPNLSFNQCTIRSNASMKCNGHNGGAVASIAVGTASGCSNPQPSSPPVVDLYEPKADSITSRCGASRSGVTWTPGTVPAGVMSANKGTHMEYHVCGTLTLSGSGYLTGETPNTDSVIIIENGGLTIARNADITTRRVTFVLTGNNNYSSLITFPNGNGHAASLSVSPSTTIGNPWRGMSIYQDPILTSTDHDWGPGATFNADGIVYLPHSDLVISGSSASEVSGCTKMVVRTLRTNGSVDLDYEQSVADCAALGVVQGSEVAAYISE